MKESLKKRLVGAITLIALAVIFIPPFIDQQGAISPIEITDIPPMPDELSEKLAQPLLTKQTFIPPQIPDHELNRLLSLENTQQQKPKVQFSSKVDSRNKAHLQAWVIQAASFVQPKNAEKLVERLRRAGLQVPEPEVVQIGDKLHYRVRVGPMLEKQAAEKLLPKINALSGSKGHIVSHR